MLGWRDRTRRPRRRLTFSLREIFPSRKSGESMVQLICTLGAVALAADPHPDIATFKGRWNAVSANSDGNEIPVEFLHGFSWFVGEKAIESVTAKGKRFDGRYTLDPTKTPKHLTVKVTVDGTETTYESIYRIKDEVLTVCSDLGPSGTGDGPRPPDFMPGKGRHIVVFRKGKSK